MNEKVKLLTDNIEKVIVGKTDSVLKIITAMLCGGHVLIEDVPGVGKTQLVSALARSVDGKYNRIQLTPDVMPSDIVGFSMIDQKTHCHLWCLPHKTLWKLTVLIICLKPKWIDFL